ncbi:hypothetical protein ACP70R_011645 [Stipagrostis hirtigluma subsp. patula]
MGCLHVAGNTEGNTQRRQGSRIHDMDRYLAVYQQPTAEMQQRRYDCQHA